MTEDKELVIAKLLQFNNKAEAQAIEDYTALLKAVEEVNMDESDKAVMWDVIGEIIADELNHQIKLQQLYTALTGIEPNKE